MQSVLPAIPNTPEEMAKMYAVLDDTQDRVIAEGNLNGWNEETLMEINHLEVSKLVLEQCSLTYWETVRSLRVAAREYSKKGGE